jgi:hypothetical protein
MALKMGSFAALGKRQEKGKGVLAREPTHKGESDRHAGGGGMRKQR